MKLTDAQQRASECIDQSAAVEAGAGSGKTLVLIERCRRLLANAPDALDHLLVMTFTEKAAAELKARLRPHLQSHQLSKLMVAWIGTFHASCARMLRSHAPLVELDPEFHILDEHAGKILSREITERVLLALLSQNNTHAVALIEQMTFRHALGLLHELMDFRWHARKTLFCHPERSEESPSTMSAVAHCYGEIERAFEQELERMGVLDFQALEMKAVQLLQDHAEVAKHYRQRFRQILVDEYQDTNDLQALFVKLLFRPEDNHLFLVGDPRQSIYRFRGANVAGFFSMAEHIRHTGGKMLPLHENFRSRPGIIRFVNRVTATLFTPPSELIAVLEPTTSPEVMALYPPTTKEHSADEVRLFEARAIADTIHHLVAHEDFSLGDIVCLFQALTSTDIYEQALRQAGLPSRIFGGGYLLERPEITDLLSALTFTAFPERNRALVALLRSPLVGLSDDDLALLAGEDGKGLRQNVKTHAEAGPILTLLETSRHLRRPSEILRTLLDETGYEIFSATVDPSGGRTANIDRFLTIIENLEANAPITLCALVRYLHDLKTHGARLGETPATAEPTNAVRMMTVHAAKGLEFPVVILPDLIRQSHRANTHWCFARGEGLGLPPDVETLALLEREADEEERKRLLYVALTRAEERLILPLHPNSKAQGLWHNWLLPFRNAPEVTVTSVSHVESLPESACPPTGVEVFSPPSLLSRTTDAVRTLTVSELETFSRCPQEYYLKHIVGVPAESLLPQHREALPAYLRGSILHSVLEELDPKQLELLPELLQRHCLANHVVPDEHLINELRAPLDAFCATPFFKSLRNGHREVPFRWQWEKVDVVGKIDWLRPEGDSWEIIDFKTDRLEPNDVSERAKSYALQMTTYALAIEAALGKKVVSTTLYFLQPGVPFTIPMDDRRRDEGKRTISAIAKRIAETDFSLRTFTPPCARPDTTCPYHLNDLCWLDVQKKKTV